MKSDKKFLYVSCLLALAAVLLLTGASPLILLLLACPVMMMFMVHGVDHGDTRHEVDHDKEK